MVGRENKKAPDRTMGRTLSSVALEQNLKVPVTFSDLGLHNRVEGPGVVCLAVHCRLGDGEYGIDLSLPAALAVRLVSLLDASPNVRRRMRA
jgi:hypothetical protein